MEGNLAAKAAATFQWEDPFLLDDQLTEEEHLVRDSARAYAQGKLMPRIKEAHRHEHFDRGDHARDGRRSACSA